MPFDNAKTSADSWLQVSQIQAAIIDRALDLLGQDGQRWTKDAYYNYGRRCAYEALMQAAMDLRAYQYLGGVCMAVRKELRHTSRWFNWCSRCRGIIRFNDARSTTFADVQGVLLSARKQFAP